MTHCFAEESEGLAEAEPDRDEGQGGGGSHGSYKQRWKALERTYTV